MAAPPVVVTLVHGTFAKGAPWTRDASALCQALRDRLGDSVQLRPFEWSGNNTHAARSRASARLRVHVAALADAHPEATQFVVAHSHGGNVAFQACGDAAVDARLRGLVCLSTPFLHYRDNMPAAMALMMLVLAITAGVGTAINASPTWSTAAKNTGMVGVTAAGVCALVLLIRRITTVKVDALNLPPVAPDRVLILRSLGDEASGLLGLSSFLQWLFLRLQTRLIGLQQAVGDALWRTKRQQVLLVVGGAVAGGVMGTVETLRPVLGYLIVGGGLLALLPLAVAVLLAPLRLLLLAAFGFDLPFRLGHVTVTAEATPQGRWTVTTVAPARDAGRTGMAEWLEPMMHSEPYDHPEAIALVCAWIDERRTAAVRESL